MDYIRVVSGLPEHPKWLALSDRARVVLIQLWCYSGRAETEGHVCAAAGRREGMSPTVASELERVAFVARNGDGWALHDWAHHQVNAADLRAARKRTRAADAERQARKRSRDVTSDRHRDATRDLARGRES